MTIDHLRLIRQPRYLHRTQRRLSQIMTQRGTFNVFTVEHEADGRCCRKEPWPATHARLFAPLIGEIAAKSPGDVQAILREHEPAVVLVTRGEYRS